MPKKKDEEAFNTLEEKRKLYREVLKRIEMLKHKEEDEELPPLPEVRELIYLALQILEKIRDERDKKPKTIEDAKKEAFGEWAKES